MVGRKSSFSVPLLDNFLFGYFGPEVNIRFNPCDGIFPKRPKLYDLSFRLAGFAGSGEEITFNIRGRISSQGPKIFIFTASCDTFLFGSFGPEVNIRLNPCDAIFPKRSIMNVSSLKLLFFAYVERK